MVAIGKGEGVEAYRLRQDYAAFRATANNTSTNMSVDLSGILTNPIRADRVEQLVALKLLTPLEDEPGVYRVNEVS